MLRERLKQAFQLEDNDEFLFDTLDGESDFKELCISALKFAHERAAMAEALDNVIDSYVSRQNRLLESVKSIRAMVADAMMEAGETKITAPEMTVSVRIGKPKVEIVGEVTDEFLREKTTMHPDKQLIAEALESGKTLPFAYLSNPGPVITVRVK
jgi:hypothetical protein